MKKQTSKTITRVDAKNVLSKSKVGIWLDSYDNFFSDFDPRIFRQRALSQDFLSQTKNITSDFKHGTFDLCFLIPKDVRNRTTEKVIVERLRKHFKAEAAELKKSKKGLLRKGILTILVGMIIMFTATFFYTLSEQSYFYAFLLILLEPTGWFMAWYGLDTVFYTAQEENSDLKFFNKMATAEVTFDTYS